MALEQSGIKRVNKNKYADINEQQAIVLTTDKSKIDTNAIDEIYHQIGWGGLRNKFQWKSVLEKSTFVVQASVCDKVVGFTRCLDDGDMCMIYDVCVHPDYQRQGIARKMMQSVMGYIQSHDFIRVQLFAYDKNECFLRPFYKEFGFQSVETGMSMVGSRFKRKA